MTIEISRDGFFYPYAVPIADAYMSTVPKSITKLWLRGDESSLTTGEDLGVSSWTDILSGVGLSFNQATISRRPIKLIGSANGHNSVFFNGQSSGFAKFLRDGGSALGAQLGNLIHLFAVIKIPLPTVSSGVQKIIANNNATTASAQHFGIRPSSNNTPLKIGYHKSTTNLINSTNDTNANQWLICEWQIKGNQPNSHIYINGQLEATATLGGQGTESSLEFSIGANTNSTEFCEIEIAEIICMNQIMTDPTNVRNYLSLRYNIPLTYP